jgi:hypothetical protein
MMSNSRDLFCGPQNPIYLSHKVRVSFHYEEINYRKRVDHNIIDNNFIFFLYKDHIQTENTLYVRISN